MEVYDLILNLVDKIEKGLVKETTIEEISKSLHISVAHLQRIFKKTTGESLMSYIRSRKLERSIDLLLSTKLRIFDIGIQCGFEHEQSYIRAFKKEYKITPMALKKSGKIVTLRDKIEISNIYNIEGGLLYGPEIVMVPQFYLIGKEHVIKQEENATQQKATKVAKEFVDNDSNKITNSINDNVYVGLTRGVSKGYDWTYYLTSLMVKDLNHIPHGYKGYTYNTSLCAKFRYMGKHHYNDISYSVAIKMYDTVHRFFEGQDRYTTDYENFFEKINKNDYDGKYCVMEWYIPINDTKDDRNGSFSR